MSASSHFRDEGIQSVVLGQGSDHPFAEQLGAAGFEIRTLNSVAKSWKDARAFCRLIDELAIDIVHVHTEANFLRTVLVARWAVRGRGKVVRTVHNVFDARGRWRAQRFLQALIGDRFLAALIAPSQDVADNEKRIGRRAKVVLNWVDDRMFSIRTERAEAPPRKSEAPVALIVGNCSRIKNHELALRALAETEHRLIHVGDERDASAEELDLLAKLECSGRLGWRGVRNPDAALREADYFLLPSLHEGMPVALAEALVVGLPALVSIAPGLHWSLDEPGVVGVSSPPAAWRRAIEEIERTDRGGGGNHFDFSATRGAREYASIYRRIIN